MIRRLRLLTVLDPHEVLVGARAPAHCWTVSASSPDAQKMPIPVEVPKERPKDAYKVDMIRERTIRVT
jgi:hypothetical protein